MARLMYRPNGVSRYSSTGRTKPLVSMLTRAATSKCTVFGGCTAPMLPAAGPASETVGGRSYPGSRGFRDRDPRQRGPTRRAGGALRVPPGRGHPPHRRPVRGGQRVPARGRPADRHRRAGAAASRARRAGRRAARRHRHRQVGHHGLADRAAAAAHAGDGAEQDPGRAAGQRAARDAAQQRGRVLRLLLRLLPARGVHRADRHLHREGLLDQRGRRAAAALGHDVPAVPPRRRRGRLGVLHLRPGHPAVLPRPVGEARRSAAASSATRCCARWSTSSTRATTWRSTAARSGCAATPWRSSRRTRSWPSASSSSATRSRRSTTCTRSPATWSARSTSVRIFPATHYVAGPERMERAIRDIEAELAERLAELESQGKLLEAQRLRHAHRLRRRDDAPGRVLLGHRELLAAHRRPRPRHRARHPDRLLPGRLPAGHRRVARDGPADRRHVRGRHVAQAQPGRVRVPAAVRGRQPAADLGGVRRPDRADGLPVRHPRARTSCTAPAASSSSRSSGPPAWSTRRSWSSRPRARSTT